MDEPVLTMMRTDVVPRASSGCAECGTGLRRDGPDALLNQAPAAFDGIEVVGIRRQEPHRGPDALDQVAHLPRLGAGRLSMIDVAAVQVVQQAAPDPDREATPVHAPSRSPR